MKTSLLAGALVLLLTGTAQSAETQKYTYDAKGRLIKVERTGSVNNGVNTNYNHDKANNRTNVTVTGSSSSGPNNAPIAVNDGGLISCIPNGYYVMANDSDPDGDPLSLVSVSGALNPYISGNIVYVSGTSPGGPFNIYYTMQDTSGATASATLTLTWATHPSCGGGGGGGGGEPEQ